MPHARHWADLFSILKQSRGERTEPLVILYDHYSNCHGTLKFNNKSLNTRLVGLYAGLYTRQTCVQIVNKRNTLTVTGFNVLCTFLIGL